MEVLSGGRDVFGTGLGVPLIPQFPINANNTGGTGTTETGAVLSVNPTYQASSTSLTLTLSLNPASTSGNTCNLSADNYTLLITYGTPGGKRGQVIIGWNRNPDGTFGNMWSRRVEPVND